MITWNFQVEALSVAVDSDLKAALLDRMASDSLLKFILEIFSKVNYNVDR